MTFLPVLVAVLLIGTDQLTKFLVLKYLSDGVPVVVIPHVVQFRYLQNTGAAFSMMSGKTIMLSIINAVVLVVLIVLYHRGTFKTNALRAGTLLIISGGFGNLIDRFFRDYVVDFIEFLFTKFAVFNFADCCVTIGAAILIIALIIDIAKTSGKEKQEN